MTPLLESAAPALCMRSSGVSLEFQGCLYEVWSYPPSRFLPSWNTHPQVPATLASSKSIPQYLKPMWWQFSAWVLSARSWRTGECLKEKAIYIKSWLSPRAVPSHTFLLAPRCSRLCLQTLFLKYFVQNLYLLLMGMFFLIQATQFLLKARTLTQNVFKRQEWWNKPCSCTY